MAHLASKGTWSRILCLYHYPCPDGAFAAFACHLAYKQQQLDNVQFIGNTTWSPVKTADLKLKGQELVYLCDFSGPPGFAVELSQKAGRCVVLDHHKTAESELASIDMTTVPNLEINFDMNRSGAVIARDYFQPKLTDTQHKMFDMIQDGDLWTWKLPESKPFAAGLASLKMNWDYQDNPRMFDELAALNPDELIAIGREKQIRDDTTMAQIMDTAFIVQLGGTIGREIGWGQGLAVIIDGAVAGLRSQLGNKLANEALARGLSGIGVVGYSVQGQFKVSLRSVKTDDCDPDTTEISTMFQGGGHRNASSFVYNTESDFDDWRIVVL